MRWTHDSGSPPGALVRDLRAHHGISQSELAARAGTTQSAISRIESGAVSPSVETLGRLSALMGARMEIHASPLDTGVDRSLLRQNLAHIPEERVRRGLAFADFARRNRGAATRK